jgi:K+-sensing histidine kinase KdpD
VAFLAHVSFVPGLGLFISQQLAHLMNGDITVKSTLGDGSRFIVTLPLMEAKELPAMACQESRYIVHFFFSTPSR